MAILFFDGFDRCTVTKDLDRNYWSFEPQQPVEYEKYAFGGYSYDHTQTNYGSTLHYKTFSPNNGILPEGTYGGYNEANTYPGFGTPLGFLALSNIDLSDNNMLAPITYLQVSGFSAPQSGQSFLNARIHGIETKDANFHTSDKAGRFDAKHPLVAFCSGNTTGLILNIIKTTGNHLEVIEDTKMTIGIEVEQLAGVSGTFDMNISNDLQEYRIRSLFSPGGTFYHGGTVQASELEDIGGRILMPTTNKNATTVPQTRWCHFQFGIIETGTIPYIQIKLDNIDLLSIPVNDSISDKDLWEDKISISGFNYDNIRFFNRTYNGSIPIAYTSTSNGINYFDQSQESKSSYYMWGANTLIDDVILNDGSGQANTFLGSNAKVIPFTPGVNGSVTDGGIVPDPYREWSTNTTSHRVALKNLDGDTGKISASILDKRTAIPYASGNIPGILPEDNWRFQVEDAIGGVKIYTQAKKEFLDSAFIPIIKTGEIDKLYDAKTVMLIRPDDDGSITDATEQQTFSFSGEIGLTDIKPFSHSGIFFNDSFIQAQFGHGDSSASQTSHLFPSTSVNADDNRFTIESWVYFTGFEPIDLYRTIPPANYDYPNPTRQQSFTISCDPTGITYEMFISGSLNLDSPQGQSVKLLFPEVIPTGQWKHVALVQDGFVEGGTYAYPLTCFLDGVAGNQHVVNRPYGQKHDTALQAKYNFRYDRFPSNLSSGSLQENVFPTGDLNIDKNMLLSLTTSSGTLTGSGTLLNPATGTFTFGANPSISDIVTFTSDDTGFLVLNMDATLTSSKYHSFEIHVNDVKQFTDGLNTASSLSPTFSTDRDSSDESLGQNHGKDFGQVFVHSGDNVAIKHSYITNTTTESQVHVKSLYVASPTGNGVYYQTQDGEGGTRRYTFGKFLNRHKQGTTNFNDPTIFPTFIGNHNIISNYRLTIGSANDDGISKTRYRNNFEVPTTGFFTDQDSYVDLGSNISLTKTRYGRVNEFHLFENPVSQEPWTTGLIGNPSGVILGVRKT